MAEPAAINAYLEHPDSVPRHRLFFVQGWVTTPARITRIAVLGRAPALLELRPRPDVLEAFPALPHSTGFFGVASEEHVQNGKLAIRFEAGAHTAIHTFALAKEREADLAARARRLERVFPLLICTACGAGFEGSAPHDGERIACAGCGAAYERTAGAYDFLPEDQRADLAPKAGDNISANEYDADALDLIREHAGGLVLDCGAGLRKTEHANVVNFEALPYRSTDVLGVNERLPFRDASFDAVLSHAVLEHVRNPFASAREICRVLKPGGKLLAVSPLLAPVHAFPHHYYNMTSEGLVNLFAPDVEVLKASVPSSGLPIYALVWMLRSWAEGLTGDAKAHFLKQRISDLMGPGHDYVNADFVKGLSAEKNFELAGTTALYGRKKG